MPAGQPRTFDSAEQLIDLWREFNDDIIDSEYSLVPTQTAFCRWLQSNYKPADRKTIYNSLNKYFPDIKAEFEQIQSDTIATGAMLGKYQPTMSIFGLKNWCGWTDKIETKNESVINVKEASEKLSNMFSDIKNE